MLKMKEVATTTKMKILIIADNKNLIKDLKKCLADKYVCDIEKEASYALYTATSEKYGLIILDNDLTSMRGSQVCQMLRQKGTDIPILMLNKKRGVSGRVSCLKRGADDCLERPFSPAEMCARIKTLIRRTTPAIPKNNIYEIGDVSIDFWNRILIYKGEEIHLRRKEFDLLELLVTNKGFRLSKEQILESVWGDEKIDNPKIVSVYVCYLRERFEEMGFDAANLIKTVYGLGYVFDDSDESIMK
ncbi:response regulator [candidate division WWE3 bacterium]|nr:response regulator [candidate division WWE3 bacterium]